MKLFGVTLKKTGKLDDKDKEKPVDDEPKKPASYSRTNSSANIFKKKEKEPVPAATPIPTSTTAPPSTAPSSPPVSRTMDSYLEEAPKKSPRESIKKAEPKKTETPLMGRKEPRSGETPTLGRKEPPRDEPTRPSRDSTKAPSTAAAAAAAPTSAAGSSSSSVPSSAPTKKESPPLPRRDPDRPARASVPHLAPSTGASGRHSVSPAVTAAAATTASSSSGLSRHTLPPNVSSAVSGGTGASGRHNLPASVTAAAAGAAPAASGSLPSVSTTATTSTDSSKSGADSVILSPAIPAKKKAAAAATRRGKSEKKRDSFYASDKFRKLEATERDESDELSSFRQAAHTVDDAFQVLPGEVYRALSDLRDIAREANTEVLTPEFLVIGLAGHGKSSVTEAILGWPLMHVEFGVPARRPVRISMQNNPAMVQPRFTLMSDPSLGMKKRVTFTDYNELRKELNVRLGQTKDLVKTPIHVLIEHAEALNFDITECPGLNEFNLEDAAAKLVLELGRSSNKTLIVVEECIEWDKVNRVLLETVLALDPNFSRTIFVHSKMNTMLQGIYNAVDISRYFSGIVRTHSATQSFWLTGLSQKCRAGCSSVAQYRLRLSQARERDLAELSYLHYDRRFEEFIGMTALRSYVLRSVVARVRACVPQIYFALKTCHDKAEKEQMALNKQLQGGLDGSHAKAFGLSYVNQFVHHLEESLVGTLNVDPGLFGETAFEEGRVDWYDEDYELASSKLVGAQQFQRLQMEIRHVISGLDFDQVLPVASYPDPPGNIKPDEANRLAAGMAHTCMTKSIAPLFYQACNRAEHILHHAFAVFDSSFFVTVSSKDDVSNQQRFVLANSPYFRNQIRDKFKKFVAEHREKLEKELKEELVSPQTLLWSLMSFPAVYAPPKVNTQGRVANTVQIHGAAQPEAPKSSRTAGMNPPETDRYKGLSAEARAELEKVQAEQKARLTKPRAVGKRLFLVQRNRVLGSVTLKFYKHFMLPLVEDLAEYLSAFVLGLQDSSEVQQLFNFSSSSEIMYKRKSELDRALDLLKETTQDYQRASTLFLTLVKPIEQHDVKNNAIF